MSMESISEPFHKYQAFEEVCGKDPTQSEGNGDRFQETLTRFYQSDTYTASNLGQMVRGLSWHSPAVSKDILRRETDLFRRWLKGKGDKDNCPEPPSGSRVVEPTTSVVPAVEGNRGESKREITDILLPIGGLILLGLAGLALFGPGTQAAAPVLAIAGLALYIAPIEGS